MMCNRKRMPEALGGREGGREVRGVGGWGVVIVRESGSCCPHGGRDGD